jgi:hypothetical protein
MRLTWAGHGKRSGSGIDLCCDSSSVMSQTTASFKTNVRSGADEIFGASNLSMWKGTVVVMKVTRFKLRWFEPRSGDSG